MAEHGEELLGSALELVRRARSEIDGIDGLHVLEDELIREEASHDLDRLHVLIDLSELGISGYQAADWLREHHRLDVGLSDHRHIEATFSIADNDESAGRLRAALEQLVQSADDLPRPHPVEIPEPEELELETVRLPRDAFFGSVEHVSVNEAAGRVAAEQITPYPPGIPAVVPGERINQPVIDYLRSGLEAGMVLPDPADPSLDTIRVCAE